MSILKFSVRAARKLSIVSSKILRKSISVTEKVESKATRILDGVDYTLPLNDKIHLEKLYYNALPETLPIHASMPAVGSKPSVTLLIPSLDGSSFFGGTATALVVAAKLSLKTDRPLRIIQTLKTGHPENLSEFFKREGVDMPEDNIKLVSVADRAYNRYGYISTHRDDIFVASAWWDAYNLSRMPLQRKFIYLVQDFEPIFYNNSDQYILAEETYKTDKFIPICNTRIMADFMKDRGYKAFQNSNFFEPAVSRIESGTVNREGRTKKTLFLYGRPNVHRNMFYTSLQAIDLAFKQGILDVSEWECYMAGQDNIPDITLSSGAIIKNRGKMSMDEYVSFSKTIDIALSPMMAPHPNYPTLEFASIGSMVVTTKYSNKQSLDMYSKNIIMSDINSESLAGALGAADKTPKEIRDINLMSNSINDSWDISLNQPLDEIIKLVATQ